MLADFERQVLEAAMRLLQSRHQATVRDISERTGWSTGYVQVAMDRLAAKGYVSRDKRRAPKILKDASGAEVRLMWQRVQ